MSTIFDSAKCGKRMPYTTPVGFFDELEDNVWTAVKDGFDDGKKDVATCDAANPAKTTVRRKSALGYFIGGAVAVAASVAIVSILTMKPVVQDSCTAGDVDRAFGQLSEDDQDFLLSVYQADVFIRE